MSKLPTLAEVKELKAAEIKAALLQKNKEAALQALLKIQLQLAKIPLK